MEAIHIRELVKDKPLESKLKLTNNSSMSKYGIASNELSWVGASLICTDFPITRHTLAFDVLSIHLLDFASF